MSKTDQKTIRHRTSAADRHDAFVRRMQDGDYRQLFGDHLNAIFAQAVEQFASIGLAEEIGSLRLVLARLLAEEHDLNRLATNVSRIVSVTIRTVQMHHDLSGQSIDDMIVELTKTLDDVDGLAAPPTSDPESIAER